MQAKETLVLLDLKMVKLLSLDFKKTKELINMQKTILRMKKSLEDDCYIAFVSANEDYHFGVRKNDDVTFLDEKTIAKYQQITTLN